MYTLLKSSSRKKINDFMDFTTSKAFSNNNKKKILKDVIKENGIYRDTS